MQPTIRDVIKRRVRWFYGAALAGYLLIMLGVGGAKTPVSIEVAAWALFFVGIVAVQWLVQCPKCSTRLGQLAASIGLNWMGRRTVRFCPYCGVNLDEPLPQKVIS